MATTVGTESDLQSLITNLIYLERDAIAAYESTIEKLSEKALSGQVQEFLGDHRQHLQVLNDLARQNGAEAPAEGDMKQMLTTGKVAFANLMGDGAILKAMKTNEDDTVSAYQSAATNEHASPDVRAFFEKALGDEERHRAWFDQTAQQL